MSISLIKLTQISQLHRQTDGQTATDGRTDGQNNITEKLYFYLKIQINFF